MRRAPLLFLVALALLLAACGTGGPGTGGNGDESTAASAAASDDEPSAEASTDGGPDGGPDTGDVEQLDEDLTPPNSTETSRTSAEGTIWSTYESTDSVDSLVNFYEDAIARTGLTVYSTTSAQGTHTWLFAEGEDTTGYGGSVTVAPSASGGDGSTVIVLVTTGQ